MIPSLYRRLPTEPFALVPARFGQLVAESRSPVANALPAPQARLASPAPRGPVGPVDYEGRPLIPQLQVVESIAVITVSGVLATGVDLWDFFCCGAFDYAWLREFVYQAMSIPGLKAIVIDWNSPGGSVVGMEETRAVFAQAAAALPLNVNHFSGGMICSAAYYLATVGNIICTSSAQIGCIGSIIALVDSSAAYTINGLKAEVFTSNGKGEPSPLKATGVPGTSLSDTQRAWLEQMVHESAAKFLNVVKAARPNATGQAFDGAYVFGEQAVKDHLADANAPSLEQLLAALLS